MRNVKVLWGMIAVLLIAVIILSFVMTARPFRFSNQPASPPPAETAESDLTLATVGDTAIHYSDVIGQLIAKQGQEQLDELIDREVIRREAEAQGVQVSESEVQQELVRMQQGYESEEQFYQSMKNQLGLSRELLKADVYHKLLKEKVAVRQIKVSDREVDEYIQKHPDEFKAKVTLRLQQIVSASRDQAQRALADLAKGSEFAQVARERSLDDATRKDGGDLGWVEQDDPFMAPALMRAAKALKVGDYSKPIDVDGSVVIVRLADRKEQSKGTPDAIRERVRTELALRDAPPIQETVQQLRQKWKVVVKKAL